METSNTSDATNTVDNVQGPSISIISAISQYNEEEPQIDNQEEISLEIQGDSPIPKTQSLKRTHDEAELSDSEDDSSGSDEEEEKTEEIFKLGLHPQGFLTSSHQEKKTHTSYHQIWLIMSTRSFQPTSQTRILKKNY